MMRSLILEAPGQLTLRQVPIPAAGPGEVVIRVRAATTCGTDLKAFLRGHPQIPMPGPLGHEYSGDVVSAGAEAPFAVGQAVMGVHSAPCQQCSWCLGGQENLCESIMATKVLGSYAEYLLVPARIARLNLFPKPADLPYAEASLLEPLACVYQGLSEIERLQGPVKGKRALVIGPGAIGLMFVTALLREGAQSVALAGRNPLRLAVGESFGANITALDDLKPEPPHGFDVVIECTGQVPIWARSIDFVRRGGLVVLFGGPPGGTRVSFDTKRVHYDQIDLISPFHFGTKAVARAHQNLPTLGLAPLISGERALEDGVATFADLQAGHGIKYAFLP